MKPNFGLSLCLGLFLAPLNGLSQAGQDVQKSSSRVWDSIKSTSNQISNSLSAAETWTTDKLNETLTEFNSYTPVINTAGFNIVKIYLKMGLIPQITVSFEQIRKLSGQHQKDVLEKHKDKEILVLLLKSLFKAYALDLGDYKVDGLRISLGVPPSTTVILTPAGKK